MTVKTIFSIVFSLFVLSCSGPTQDTAAKKVITKDLLYQHCSIPQKRAMPLSSEISPCDDFYGYVCNEVVSNFILPEDRSRWTFSFTDNAERILCAKKEYFHLIDQGYSNQSERLNPAKNLYLSCMDKTASTLEEEAMIQREMNLLNGIKTKKELLELFKSRIDSSISGVISFRTPANQDNSKKFDLTFSTRMRYLRERSYIKNKKLMKDFNLLAKNFFDSAKFDNASKRAKWVSEYEKQIQMATLLPAQRRKRYSQRHYKPRDYFKKYNNLGISEYFSKVPEDMPIRDVFPESLEFMNQWLEESSLEEIKSVYAFYTYNNWMDDAYPQYFKQAFNFDHKYLGGSAQRAPRNERCTKLVMHNYGMELDEELINILFPDFDKQKVVDLAEDVRESLVDGLKNNTWLSPKARKEAIRKITDAKLHLVKPDNEEDWNFLPVLNLNPETQIQNNLKIRQARIDRNLEEIKSERSQTKWWMGPLTSNAYYSSSDNKFVLLLGILQYPFYDSDNSRIQNIGAIGSIVGHELGHSIDDNGSRFDSKGQLRQWMSKEDLTTFKHRGSLFIERFNKIGHNGELTLGENIGDHVGITSSFHAVFPESDKVAKKDLKLFFESYARSWCQKMRPKYREAQLKTDPHALGFARVNEQVVHLDRFYDAYQCSDKSKMYIAPKDRIRVW